MHINFNSFGLDLTGGNRFIFELSNALVERGHRVTITHLGNKKNYAWFPEVRAEVINLNFAYPGLRTKLYRKTLGQHINHNFSGLSYAEMALVNGIPDCDVNVATFCMTAFPTYYSRKGAGFYLVQHYEPLFFVDNKCKDRAASTYTLPLKKLCVSSWLTGKVQGCFIGNGINPSKFRNIGVPKGYDVMCIVRKINWKGNYFPVVDALRKRGLKVLTVDGTLTEQQLVSAYNTSRVFMFLSEHEGFGYPPLEAMACGVPVITTPCLEYAEHLNNVVILKKDYTTEDVVNAVYVLLGDNGLYDKLSVNGSLTAKQLDFKHVVDRFEGAILLNDRVLTNTVSAFSCE